MIRTIIGTKENMGQFFDQFGRLLPITTVVADPNVVLSVSEDRVQIGFGQKKKTKKTENSFINGVGFSPRIIKEVSFQKSQVDKNPSVGDKITVAIFEPGDLVKVTGTSKGRGFAGGVKRWGFHGGPKTHGQSDRHRAPGSSGQGTTPGRVYKGKKMAGHYGNEQITVIGLEVIEVDESKNIIKVKGAVPGWRNGLLIIEKTGKTKGYTPPPPPKEVEEENGEANETKDTEKSDKPNEEKKTDSKEEQSKDQQEKKTEEKEEIDANEQDK